MGRVVAEVEVVVDDEELLALPAHEVVLLLETRRRNV
jgi:hypothetical protein